MSAVVPHGEHLSPETLHLYLRDPTFVEYFNSFLLLPAFSSCVFYNADSGYFEQVHGEGVRGCREEGVTPSTSVSTLYLMEGDVGPSLDPQQSWLWVTQHRLPLFLRSDLYSEYKLCKVLTAGTAPKADIPLLEVLPSVQIRSPSPKRQSPHPRTTGSISGSSSTVLPMLPSLTQPSCGTPYGGSLSSLPQGSNFRPVGVLAPPSSSTPDQSTKVSIGASKSNIELGHSHGKVGSQGGATRKSNSLKRSLSMEFAVPVTSPDQHRAGEVAGEMEDGPSELRAEDYAFLGTKSGMGSLWRFLRGKAGERNWLFWLDAERISYYSKPIDQQRLLRELRERYLHAGSPLEIPPEIRRELRLSKASRMTMEQLRELQRLLAQGLREYWCPRFILNYRCQSKLSSSSSTPSRSMMRSRSTTPFTLTSSSIPHPYNSIPSLLHTHPLTPSRTPTFRRHSGKPRSKSMPSSNQRRHRQQTSPLEANQTHELCLASSRVTPLEGTSIPRVLSVDGQWSGLHSKLQGFASMECLTTERQRPFTAPEIALTTDIDSANDSPGSGTIRSRKIWTSTMLPVDEGLEEEDGGRRVKERCESRKGRLSSAALYSRLAKYTQRHLPDCSSRCASAMDSRLGMCEGHCRVLSVSGTPIHQPSTPHLLQQGRGEKVDKYSIFLRCLGTEQRKAGGYFQEHLEKMEDKVYLNCLLFWWEVQSYKSLFLRQKFSPCAVEMKAKALYGRYITGSSEESIRCPPLACSQISTNLFPPYEDLFDGAEEYVLDVLFEKWVELRCSEERAFEQVGVATGLGDGRGLMDDLEELDEDDDQADVPLPCISLRGSPSPTKHSSRASPALRSHATSRLQSPTLSRCPSPTQSAVLSPPKTKAVNLNDILNNPTEIEHFKVFLNENFAAQDLMFWMEIEAFRGIPTSERHLRDITAKHLRSKYFTRKYYFGPNSPASKEAQRQTVAAGGGGYSSHLPSRPKTPVYREAQKYVRARLEKKWLAMFITTPEFLARNQISTMDENGRRKSTTVVQGTVYEKAFSSSHEALLLRKALQDETLRGRFLCYLTLNGRTTQFPQQDIEFWLEVQRYKDMCHAHTTKHTLQAKVSAIIDCYFLSQVPPALQLDIPQAIATQVISKPLGPYIFREAQASVFKQLYHQWQDYQNFTSDFAQGSDIDRALSKLGDQIRRLHSTAIHKEIQDKMEEERRRMSAPRFETVQEKIERKKREKELAEFGKAAVMFRLSTPNPAYMYYTELPGGEEEEGLRNEPSQQGEMQMCWEEPTGNKRTRTRQGSSEKKPCIAVTPTMPSVGGTGKVRESPPNQKRCRLPKRDGESGTL